MNSTYPTVFITWALMRSIPLLVDLWSDIYVARHRVDDPSPEPRRISTPRPMYPSHASSLPIGDEWSYEVKFRGRRAIAVKHDHSVAMYSPGFNLPSDFVRRHFCRALGASKADIIVMDGQLIRMTAWHRAWWPDLARFPVIYSVFDLLRLQDDRLYERPLAERRAALAGLGLRAPLVQLRPMPASAEEVVALLRRIGFDAIAKRRNSPYEPGVRSNHWRLVKIPPAQGATNTTSVAVEIPPVKV